MIKKFLKMLKIITERREETPNVNWVEINESNKKHYNNYVIPKLIWIYWDSETLPEIVRMCIEQVKKLCSDYEVMVLNENNVHNYITLLRLMARSLNLMLLISSGCYFLKNMAESGWMPAYF